jgi:hypothetical protein
MDIQSCSSADLDAINERAREAKCGSLNADPVKTVGVEVLNATETAIQEINERHAKMNELAKDALENAIRIGELLTEQRKLCKHGEWLSWLAENVEFSQQTDDRYRKLYANRDILLTVSNIAEAYRLIIPKSKKSAGSRKLARVDGQRVSVLLDKFLAGIEPTQHCDVLRMIGDDCCSRIEKLKG